MIKKNLLIVSDSFLPRWDGVARFLAEVIPKLKDDFNITVIAPDFQGTKVSMDGVNIVRAPLSRFTINDLPLAKFSRSLIKPYVEDSDIVLVQDLSTLGYSAIKLAKQFKKTLISYVHVINWDIVSKSVSTPWFITKFIYWFSKVFSRSLYNKCDILMIPTSDIAFMLEKEKITAAKVVVPQGIDSDKFKSVDDKDAAKELLGIDPEYKVIGYCGRIGREKNLKTLCKAFFYIKKRFPNTKLMLVGKGPESEEKAFREKQTKDIILFGEQDDVIPYLQAMDIYVLPSLTETTSLSTLEAMSCGLPVIVTQLPAMKKYVIDKRNGFFFPKENWLVLSKKLEQLLEQPALRFAVGQEARKTVRQKYSWEVTVQKMKEVLDKF